MDELRKQARECEADIERNFDKLENICNSIDPEALHVRSEAKLPEETVQMYLEMKLSQLKHSADQMAELAVSRVDSSLATSFKDLHKRSALHLQELRKKIEHRRWQQELLGDRLAQTDSTVADNLVKESRSLDHSLQMGRTVLETSSNISTSFAYQKSVLEGTGDKLVRFAETLPGINVLISRISKRKRLNAVVIGLTIAVCCILLLAYLAYT